MVRVGITGGIGSGKTTVCEIFLQLNVPVYASDDAAKKLMQNNDEVKRALIEILGSQIYLPDGELNKKEIAHQIFNNSEKKIAVERIVHTAVGIDSEHWFKNLIQSKKNPYAIYESALLFESQLNHLLDKIIVVTAPEALRIARVMARSNGTLSENEVRQRIKNQNSDAEKIKLADFVIHNDNSEMLIQQVLRIHQSLLTFAE